MRQLLSPFERFLLCIGLAMTVAAVPVAMYSEDVGGVARGLALAGLASIVGCAFVRGARLYREGVTASLPSAVAQVQVRVRPARGFNTLAITLSVVLPVGAFAAVAALVEWAWLPLAGLLLLGCVAVFVSLDRERRDPYWYTSPSEIAPELLERLCMRADMPTPELVVHYGGMPSAWTVGGRIHITRRLLKLLDDAELEAVLAHEVAHLARRDAAAMEICSAPSRVLLAFTRVLVPWTRAVLSVRMIRTSCALIFLGVLCGPPALVLGWTARLSVLGMSRAREFGADAAAVTLTGRPSALASALMKLDDQREWTPRADLRQAEPYAMLCIVGTTGRRLGRLFATHPPVAERVSRLERIESRIQAGPYA